MRRTTFEQALFLCVLFCLGEGEILETLFDCTMQLKMLLNLRRAATLCVVSLMHLSVEVLGACKVRLLTSIDFRWSPEYLTAEPGNLTLSQCTLMRRTRRLLS